MEYLKRKDFHQVLRNEILWGLIPKTLVAKSNPEYQQHTVPMAMKTLECRSFLRGPGILQLETIQKYFNIIKEEPEFKARKENVKDFCREGKTIVLNNCLQSNKVTNIGQLL